MSVRLSEIELRAIELALTGDISDPVELMRKAGVDVTTFFEFGRWSLDFRRSDLTGISFLGADLSKAKMTKNQIEYVRSSQPLHNPKEPTETASTDRGPQKRGNGQVKRVAKAVSGPAAPLGGVFSVTPIRHGDDRGFFSESWNRRRFAEAGINIDFVQDNHSISVEPGTVRGLHFQSPPHAQAKLVRCGRGRLFDVVVDIRKGSPTFGRWVGQELSFENGKQLFIPAGFLHGFVTREPDTEIVYKTSDYFHAECDGAVHWDSCGIDWGLEGEPVLSAKDDFAPPFSEFESPFTWDPSTDETSLFDRGDFEVAGLRISNLAGSDA